MKGVQVTLYVDNIVEPVAQRARRITFHVCKKVETELHKLEQQGIIEKVDGLVSPLVVTPKKDGDVHTCVDM